MAIRLPVLASGLDQVDRIEIETPCQVSWDSMHGDHQVRHCGSCRQNVYNVASLTRAQAMQLITSRERVCVRIYRRPDGTVVTNDCWSRLRAARRRGVWAFIAMLIVLGWAQLAAMFVGITGLRRVVRSRATMGESAMTEASAPILGFRGLPAPPLPEVMGEFIAGGLKGADVGPPEDLMPEAKKKTKKKVKKAKTKVETIVWGDTATLGRMKVR